MPSEFADLERLATGAIDSTFGEETRVEPRADGQYLSGNADPDRSPVTVVGIPDFNPITRIAQDTGKYDGLRPEVAGDRVDVSYDLALFTDWKPKKGDRIILTERSGQPEYRISRVEPDGIGRIVCVCTIGDR